MAFEQEAAEEENQSGSQVDLIGSYLAYARRAIRAHLLLATLLFLTVSALTIAIVAVLPRTYHCEMKVMTERTDMLVRNDRTEGFRSAPEMIHRHDNLEAVVRQTELAKEWPLSRPPLLRFKDKISTLMHGPMSEADLESMLIPTLDGKLGVTATENPNTLSIGVDWHEPRMAARIVEAAYQRYLEGRHGADVSTIAEYISILEGHASDLRQEIDTIAEQVQKLVGDKPKPGDRNAAASADAQP